MKMGDVLGLDEGESRRRTDGVEIAGRGKQKAKWQERWEDSKGMLLILCSELFGAGMAAAARLLEMGDGGMMTLHVSSSLMSLLDLALKADTEDM